VTELNNTFLGLQPRQMVERRSNHLNAAAIPRKFYRINPTHTLRAYYFKALFNIIRL